MADQLRWWKLWTSALSDPDLEALSLEDFARWCRLGAWLRVHGEGGVALLSRPGRSLVEAWRSRTWKNTLAILSRLPGVSTEVLDKEPSKDPCRIRISVRNWRKYQEDSSVQRTRAWRERRAKGDGQPASRGD